MTQNYQWSLTGRVLSQNRWTNDQSKLFDTALEGQGHVKRYEVGWIGSDGCISSLPNGWFYEWQDLPTHQFLFDKYLQISSQRSLDSAFQRWICLPCMLGTQPMLQVHCLWQFFKAAFPFLLDGLQDFLDVTLVCDDSDMISDLKWCPYFLLLLEVSFYISYLKYYALNYR